MGLPIAANPQKAMLEPWNHATPVMLARAASLKQTWNPKKGPTQTPVLEQGSCMGFHASLGEGISVKGCSWSRSYEMLSTLYTRPYSPCITAKCSLHPETEHPPNIHHPCLKTVSTCNPNHLQLYRDYPLQLEGNYYQAGGSWGYRYTYLSSSSPSTPHSLSGC